MISIKLAEKRDIHMANFLTMVLIAVIGVVGIVPTAAITIMIPAVIIWKIIRKIKNGYSLYQ